MSLAAAAGLVAAAAPPTGEVDLTVTGLRSAEGVVLVCLTRDADRFPKCDSRSSFRRVVPATAGAVHLEFKDVPPGRYGIAVLHDENENGRADRVLGMMPKEGFGFSRDAPVRMAPPRFADAAFEVRAAPSVQTVRMRYMF
ncbi:MAG: DUF2141 domain-containing protein [Tsuneonella sp.]